MNNELLSEIILHLDELINTSHWKVMHPSRAAEHEKAVALRNRVEALQKKATPRKEYPWDDLAVGETRFYQDEERPSNVSSLARSRGMIVRTHSLPNGWSITRLS